MISAIDQGTREVVNKVLTQLASEGYRIITFYHPLNRDMTARIFIYINILKPVGTSVVDYTVEGRDITFYLSSQSTAVQSGGVISASVRATLESLPVQKWKFSSDYSFEEIIG